MNLKSCLFLIIYFHIFYVLRVLSDSDKRIYRKGCYTLNNEIGVCVPYNKCPLAAYYIEKNQNYAYFLRRACSWSLSDDRSPLVCCEISSNFNQTQILTTTTNSPSIYFVNKDKKCIGPDSVPGVCKDLAQCSTLLDELKEKQKHSDIFQFLLQSNIACKRKLKFVCCPDDEKSYKDTKSKSIVKLPTFEDGCGETIPFVMRKIIIPQNAIPGAWPWVALIAYAEQFGIEFKCGGSLITEKHVLTAAHCTHNKNNLQFVRLGEQDLSTDTETRHIDVAIAKTTEYPSYSKQNRYGDIAIIHLQQFVEFNKYIKPICLPLTEELRTKSFVDYNPFVAGWGVTPERRNAIYDLEYYSIPIHKNEVCVNGYARKSEIYFPKQYFDNSIICAGHLFNREGVCQGDSGGSIMMPKKFNGKYRFFALGVASHIKGCQGTEIPGIYTNVQVYVNWIENVVLNI